MSFGVEPARAGRYQTIGKYRILAHIATGGMGAVYRALDIEANREVALKLLAPEPIAEQPKLLERFRREAKHGARLQHENIVSIYEFGESAGAYFLVMEFVDGVDLMQRIQDDPVDLTEARSILLQMAWALEHAHRYGIVHRDVKPSNILLTEKQGETLAKLGDFGLAQNKSERESRVTRDGFTVGTIDYISPEQARDSGSADIRSDIYSLGCTIYHVLAGVPPFQGTVAEKIYKRLETAPPSVRKHNPATPRALAAIIAKMLQPAPEDRYQTPAELIEALMQKPKSVAEEVISASPSSSSSVSTSSATPPPSGAHKIASGRYDFAMQLLAAGDIRQGIAVLHECCKFDPYNTDYRRRLRHVVQARPKGWHEAPFAWMKALAAQRRLQAARKAGAHLKVLELGEEVLTHRSGDVATQVAMAQAAEALGQMEFAVWLLKHARRKDAPNLAVKRALALLYENQKNLPAAIAAWESVRRADANNTEAQERIRDLSARETIARGRYEELEEE